MTGRFDIEATGGNAARASAGPTSARSCRRCTPRTAVAFRARRAHRADPQRHPPSGRRARRGRARRRGARASRSGTPGRPSPLVHLDPDARRRAGAGDRRRLPGRGRRRDGRPRLRPRPRRSAAWPRHRRGHRRRPRRARRAARRPRGAREALVGIGVAVVGVVRRHDGVRVDGPEPRLARRRRSARRSPRRSASPVPIVVANEADLGALAEHRRGAAAGTDDVIFLSGEVGVGGGLIVGGRPLTGVAGHGGEVGHIPVNPRGRHDVPVRLGRLLGDRGGRGGVARPGRPAAPTAAARRSRRSSPTPPRRRRRRSPRWPRSAGGWGSGSPGSSTCFNPERVVLGGRFARPPPVHRRHRRRTGSTGGRWPRPARSSRSCRRRSASTPRCSARPSWRSSRSSPIRRAGSGRRRHAGSTWSPTKRGNNYHEQASRTHPGPPRKGEGTRMHARRTAALIMSAAWSWSPVATTMTTTTTTPTATPTEAGATTPAGAHRTPAGTGRRRRRLRRRRVLEQLPGGALGEVGRAGAEGGHRGRRRHVHLERRQVVGRDAGEQHGEPHLPGRQRPRRPRPGRHGHQAVRGQRDRRRCAGDRLRPPHRGRERAVHHVRQRAGR